MRKFRLNYATPKTPNTKNHAATLLFWIVTLPLLIILLLSLIGRLFGK